MGRSSANVGLLVKAIPINLLLDSFIILLESATSPILPLTQTGDFDLVQEADWLDLTYRIC